jgi:metallo-beta-lactamase class B
MNVPTRIACLLTVLCVLLPRAIAQPTPEELAKSPPLFLETARRSLKWDEPAEPAHLAGPIYFVGTQGLGVFLITGSDGHILVNTGMPGSGPMIAKSIRKLGFKPEDVKLLLTAHAHVDHAGGHAYLKKACGAKIAMIREEQQLFESGGKTDFQYGDYKEFQFEAAKVDQVFKDGDEIKLGDITLLALLTPGHTEGSTTFVMKIIDDGKLLSVVFPNGTGVNPGYRLAMNPSYKGIADDYRRTFRVLESLRPDIWLYAHNEAYAYDAKLARSAKEGVRAWIDRDGYSKWVAGARQKFEAALAKETEDK